MRQACDVHRRMRRESLPYFDSRPLTRLLWPISTGPATCDRRVSSFIWPVWWIQFTSLHSRGQDPSASAGVLPLRAVLACSYWGCTVCSQVGGASTIASLVQRIYTRASLQSSTLFPCPLRPHLHISRQLTFLTVSDRNHEPCPKSMENCVKTRQLFFAMSFSSTGKCVQRIGLRSAGPD